MDRESELEIVRRAYAKQVMAAAEVTDRQLEAAYAAVKREDFLGRSDQVTVMNAIRAGADPRAVLTENLVATVDALWLRGDAQARHNLPGREWPLLLGSRPQCAAAPVGFTGSARYPLSTLSSRRRATEHVSSSD